MVSNGIKRCQMIGYMVTLALVTPIGMIIGIILTIHVDGESGQPRFKDWSEGFRKRETSVACFINVLITTLPS